MRLFHTCILILFFLSRGIVLLGTHNRAGEITFRQINNLSIEVTITTYTKASSISADRDSLELFWGDNTSQFIKRDNSKTKFETNDVKINYYIAQHTYPGPATYTMYFVDPNRVSTILNINYPNSVDIPFFLSTTFTLLNQQFQGINNSVVLLQPPLDIACAGKKFSHNPNGFDPDGDSLVYELAIPLQASNIPVPGYQYPDEIAPGPNNKISINPRTGEFIWDAPVLQGEYNIAIRILEYRKGQLINTVLRDMQILVRACVNDPPDIESPEEICVVAGDTIDFNIAVKDVNNGQKIKLFATGGPFVVENSANLFSPASFTASPIQARFLWITNCDHISKDYYQIVLRAVDDYFSDSSGLATLKTIRIKVVGPPPENLQAKSEPDGVRLQWDRPYACDENGTQKFTGFAIYRSQSSILIPKDTCSPGLSNSGYTKIAISVKSNDINGFTFLDSNIEKGFIYCYRVVGEFSLFTPSGVPYAKIEGLPSDEICIQTSRETPLITMVSVEKTNTQTGEIEVRWSKPAILDADSLLYPPPYMFIFNRSSDGSTFTELSNQTRITNNLAGFTDTSFVDVGLNTEQMPYTYRVDFYASGSKINSSQTASSIFLTPVPSDKKIILTWQQTVPWTNYEYEVYRIESNNSVLLGITTDQMYIDEPLENGQTYCYLIRSNGRYNLSSLNSILQNKSQVACTIPLDNVAPCSTAITVQNPCDLIQSGISISELFNKIEWQPVQDLCPDNSMDLAGYFVYYAVDQQAEFTRIVKIEDLNITQYLHYPEDDLAGCYFVTAYDTLGNESLASNIYCLENCPLYTLPNTFTPNNDQHNDIFTPTTNFFIYEVDFLVYNQWGNLVFKTTEPELNWDGKNFQGKLLEDGVYHYTCRVYIKLVDGTISEEPTLTGFIQIIR